MTEAVVLGVIDGLTIGLLAVGIVLVYKANRFINLAHAQLGTLSAVLLAKFVLDWSLSWWLAFPIAVGIGIGIGLVSERWVIRPLRRRSASSETLLLASIGLAQLLLALVFITALRPNNNLFTQKGYPLPFNASVEIGGVALNADRLLLLALGAAAAGGFVSVPAACIGGVGLGIVDHVAQHVAKSGADATLVVFAAIILMFVVRAGVISRAAGVEARVSVDRHPLRVPSAVAGLFFVRQQRLLLAAGGLLVGLVAPLLPYFNTDAHRFDLALIMAFALVGVGLTMLVGWAGQVSLGHFALMGLGSFITARLAPHGWSLPLLLVLSGLAGAAAMAVIGLPALRLRGLTLAVTTLGAAVVAPIWLFRQHWFGSDTPFGLIVQPAAIAKGLGRPFDQLDVD